MRLRKYWLPLVILTVLLSVGIVVAAPNYSDAQYASTAEEFRAAVPADEIGRYRLGAVIDIGFAVAYALVALVVLDVSRAWAPLAARLAAIGCWLVVAGAVFDVIENVVVFVNVGNRDTLEDGAVELMSTVGAVKWAAILLGLVLVLVARILQWVRPAGPPAS